MKIHAKLLVLVIVQILVQLNVMVRVLEQIQYWYNLQDKIKIRSNLNKTEEKHEMYSIIIHTQGGFSDKYGNKDDIQINLESGQVFDQLDFIPIMYSFELVGIFDTQNNRVFDNYGMPAEGIYFDSQGRWIYDGNETVPIELYAIWDKIEFIYDDTKRRVPYSDNQTLPVWEDELDSSE